MLHHEVGEGLQGNDRDVSHKLSSKGGTTGTTGNGSGTHSRPQRTVDGSELPSDGGRSSLKTSDNQLSGGSGPSATLSDLAGKLLGDPFLR